MKDNENVFIGAHLTSDKKDLSSSYLVSTFFWFLSCFHVFPVTVPVGPLSAFMFFSVDLFFFPVWFFFLLDSHVCQIGVFVL